MWQNARQSLTIALVAAVTAISAAPAAAEPIIALTNQNALIVFDSSTPGTVSAPIAVSGLLAGQILVGIDRRPNEGRLYGVGVNLGTGSASAYTLDEATGIATFASMFAADPGDVTNPFPFTTVSGTSFGLDFNPVVDRLRMTSNTGQNLRINVDSGRVQLDVPLAYQFPDPNFGDSPVAVAVAYTNSFSGATTTTLRGVDIGQLGDALVTFINPNGGTLQTALTLPFDSGPLVSFDISGPTGVAYFAVTSPGGLLSQLYSDGPGGVTLIGTIGGGVAIRGIAAPVGTAVPEPASVVLTGVGLAGLMARRRWRRR